MCKLCLKVYTRSHTRTKEKKRKEKEKKKEKRKKDTYKSASFAVPSTICETLKKIKVGFFGFAKKDKSSLDFGCSQTTFFSFQTTL